MTSPIPFVKENNNGKGTNPSNLNLSVPITLLFLFVVPYLVPKCLTANNVVLMNMNLHANSRRVYYKS